MDILSGANDSVTIFGTLKYFSLYSYLLFGYTKKDVRSSEDSRNNGKVSSKDLSEKMDFHSKSA